MIPVYAMKVDLGLELCKYIRYRQTQPILLRLKSYDYKCFSLAGPSSGHGIELLKVKDINMWVCHTGYRVVHSNYISY
jgi:hypothetical protein